MRVTSIRRSVTVSVRYALLFLAFFAMTAAAANTYYVDATGGDDRNSGASPASAWRTLAKVGRTTLRPGDTVLFKRGETWREELTIQQSGAPGAPITFADYGSGDKPLFDGENTRNGVHASGKSYITMRNIAVKRGMYGFWFYGGSTNNVLDSVEASLTSAHDGIAFQDDGSVGNQVLNCTSHDNVNGAGVQFGVGAGNSAVIGGTYYNNPSRHASGVEFDSGGNLVRNVTSYSNWYGIKLFGSDAKNNTAENNISHDNSSFGIDVDFTGPGSIVQNNVSYSNGDHGIAIEGTTDGAIVRYNVTHNNGRPNRAGIELDGTTNTQVYYNVVYGEYNGIWSLGGAKASIYNNTVYNSLECFLLENGSSDITLKNNIASTCSGADVQVAADSISGFRSDFNDWQEGGNLRLTWAGATYNLTGWKTASIQDANSIDADPQFVNAGAGDFHLRLTSPAIDLGAAVGLAADFAGASVPQGKGVDLGAFEYTSTPPPGVSGLSCNPGLVVTPSKATCTVSLTAAAPNGGVAVTITSFNSIATVSSPVTVPAGQSSAAFTVTAAAVVSDATALLTAGANHTSVTFSLGLLTPLALSLSCAPATLYVPGASTCTVSLTRPASGGGITVTLSASPSIVTIPGSATASAGDSSANFTASAGAAAALGPATLTASFAGISATFVLTTSLPGVAALACNPPILTGQGSTTCTVSIGPAAPSGGAGVTISSSSPQLTASSPVLVAAGNTTAQFTATSAVISSDESAVLAASWGNSSQTATISLLEIKPASLACSPQTILAESNTQCQLSLNAAALNALTVNLFSNNAAALTVPTSVTFREAEATLSFSANGGAVSGQHSAVITASYGKTSVNATVSVTSGARPPRRRNTNVPPIPLAPLAPGP